METQPDQTEVETVETVKPPRYGVCRIPGCNVAMPDGRTKLCPEHKHLSKHRGNKTPKASTPPPTAERITAKPSAPSPQKATPAATQDTLSKFLIVFSVILCRAMLARRRIPDPNGQHADTLSFTNTEAKAISAPLARVISTNATAARMAGPVVKNQDVLAAVLALYDWQHRVSTYLETAQMSGSVHNVSPRQAERPRSTAADMASMPQPAEEETADDLSAFQAQPAAWNIRPDGQLDESAAI